MKQSHCLSMTGLLVAGIWLALSGFGGEQDVSHGATQADETPTRQVAATPAVLHQGKAIYQHYCWPCHGLSGAGDGPAANMLNPRPRDFTQAHFKLRSTGFGELPTALYQDIFRQIQGCASAACCHRG